jgi:RNA polymerase sigma-70 factor (ECF subfamily)
MEEVSLQELVERAASGEEAAIERLYHLYSRRIYSLCRRVATDQIEAEHLTREIFIQAFRQIDTFRKDAAFSIWILRIAANVLMQVQKRPPLAPVEEVSSTDA